jgi:hypothetical protein
MLTIPMVMPRLRRTPELVTSNLELAASGGE